METGTALGERSANYCADGAASPLCHPASASAPAEKPASMATIKSRKRMEASSRCDSAMVARGNVRGKAVIHIGGVPGQDAHVTLEQRA